MRSSDDLFLHYCVYHYYCFSLVRLDEEYIFMLASVHGLEEKEEEGGTLVLFTIAYILFICMYHTSFIARVLVLFS